MRGSKLNYALVDELADAGFTIMQIAQEIGCHHDTVRKHLNSGHKQYNQIIPAPSRKPFPLHVGNKVSAYEPDISSARHIYRVISINRYTYTCERVHGYPWKVSFEIKDFGMPSDRAHVKCLS